MEKVVESKLEAEEEEELGRKKKKMRKAASGWLREKKVRELVRDKRRLVEVPYTATLANTVNALVANNVVAMPVAAPPGRWIGAGGTIILESDRATGAVRKHYIGMVTMLDILVHITDEEAREADTDSATAAGANPVVFDLDKRMSVPVSSIIGHSLEGLTLWTLNPHTSILDCMEAFSKGVHRALVPIESQTENVVDDVIMLTQMDILHFLRAHAADELKDITSCTVGELGAINENVFSVTKHMKLIEAIKSMRSASLTAVPIVEDSEDPGYDHLLLDRKGRRLVGTLSATDLRGCPMSLLQSCLFTSVVEFIEKVSDQLISSSHQDEDEEAAFRPVTRKPVICYSDTSLAEVIEEAVVEHVHRVWVVDKQGLLTGLISLTDMLRVIREQ